MKLEIKDGIIFAYDFDNANVMDVTLNGNKMDICDDTQYLEVFRAIEDLKKGADDLNDFNLEFHGLFGEVFGRNVTNKLNELIPIFVGELDKIVIEMMRYRTKNKVVSTVSDDEYEPEIADTNDECTDVDYEDVDYEDVDYEDVDCEVEYTRTLPNEYELMYSNPKVYKRIVGLVDRYIRDEYTADEDDPVYLSDVLTDFGSWLYLVKD